MSLLLCAPALAQSVSTMRVNEMLGMGVTDRSGTAIGEVRELMLDLKTGRLHYAVLELTRLGLGEKQFAYPVTVLAPGKARDTLRLDVAREEIERSEGFMRGRFPASNDEYWSRVEHRSGAHEAPEVALLDPGAPARTQAERGAPTGDGGGSASAGQSAAAPELVRASHLLGLPVYDPKGRPLGTVIDIVATLREARVRHLVLESERGGRRLSVPPTGVLLDSQARALRLKSHAQRPR